MYKFQKYVIKGEVIHEYLLKLDNEETIWCFESDLEEDIFSVISPVCEWIINI